MTKVVLYSQEISPPCRTVLMTAHAIGLDLEIREMNLLNGDHMKEEFIKINPKHTIPTMDDNGFILADSHAIVTYLVDKYAKDDSLYPKDLQKRALVNEYLFFDTGILFNIMRTVFKPVIFDQEKPIPESRQKALNEVFEILDTFLKGKKWLLGDSYTLADMSNVTSASSAAVVVNLDDYPNVKAWIQRCEAELPGYKEWNVPGKDQIHALIRSRLD